jgi:hypothetical protein
VIYYFVASLLLALIFAVLMTTQWALLLSPVIGALAFFFWRLIDPEESGSRGHLRAVLTAAIGSAIGFGAGLLMGFTDAPLFDAAGILLAGIVASALYSWRAQSRTVTCVLCQNPASGSGGFDCPRCGDRVCTRGSCWNSRHARCTRCFEREIVILPIHEKWWAARLGKRVMTGECLSCGKEAQEPGTDLRDCGQCHWPMCRRCWDYYNGICQRCEWVIPDLPPRLAPFVRRARRKKDQARPHRGTPARGGGAPPSAPAARPSRPRPAPRDAADKKGDHESDDDRTRPWRH